MKQFLLQNQFDIVTFCYLTVIYKGLIYVIVVLSHFHREEFFN